MAYTYKSVTNSVLDVDDKSRRVKVAISEMGSVDTDNDIIDHNAYTKTITERGPAGKNKIYHLTNHRADLQNTLGKFSELYVEGSQLVGVNNIIKTGWGNDVLEMYKSGTITEHSVGFTTVKADEGKNDEPRLIKEIKLYEGSAVLWGANENTPTLSVGKSLTKQQRDFQLNKILKELSSISGLYRNGNYSDELGELIEIRMLQLDEAIRKLFTIVINYPSNTTTAAIDIDAQEPDNEELEPLIDLSSLRSRGAGKPKGNKPELSFAEQLLLSTI